MPRRDTLPDWLSDELILGELAERELRERGLLVEEEEPPVPPLTLKEFVHEFWDVLEPGTPMAWDWALDAMCLHLEAAARRQIKRLIINVPPGTAKSSLTNVFFPAWVWAEINPSERFLAVAFTESLALRDSMAMRRLILSPEYVVRYGERVQLTRDNNAKGEYDTNARGRRAVRPITAATGVRANILLIDDPNNAAEVHSPAHRRSINNAYDNSLSRRGADPKKYVQICIMQRLHQDDLTGHLETKGGWEVLRLPEKYEPEHHTKTSIWEDPRTERGELLFPEFRDEADYAQAAIDLGIVKRWWWRYHAPAMLLGSLPPVAVLMPDGTTLEIHAVATPAKFERKITSWDMSFKGHKDSDYVVGQAHGSIGADSYLLDQTRGQWGFVQTKAEVRRFTAKHGDIREHIVEDKANGTAIIDELRSEISGLIGWEPEGSKESRVHAESPAIEAGNVYLPHPALAPWVSTDFLPEWELFPNGVNDDQIDPLTQARQRLRKPKQSIFL